MRSSIFPVVTVLGFATALFSVSFLVPLAYAFATNEPTVDSFATGFLITFFVGLAAHFLTRRFKRELQPRDGFLLVSAVWSLIPAFSTIPLVLFFDDLSFTDAYFETVSGLTTTGATVLTGLDTMPASINIWRHLLSWIGGMGILVLAVAILPLLGVGGSQVFKAETPGPMKDSKLTPRITETAKSLYLVYVALSLACAVSYKLAGMTWLDAFMHSGTTMSLSGFSSHDASFAYFDSPAIEMVSVAFMLISGVNFAIHFLAWRGKSFRPYVMCPETKWFLVLMLVSVLLIATFLLAHQQYTTFSEAFRFSLFNVVSVATTTGFANTDFGQWPIFAPLFMLFLSVFASAAGSTGGGIKMLRAVILFQHAVGELSRTLHPRAVNPVRIRDTVVSSQVISGVLAFMMMYGMSIITITMIQMFTGLEPIAALTGTIAMINCTGPGLGVLGPASNYSSLGDFQTWVYSFAMLLGRLEMFTILVLFTPAFWRK
ncbi:trk system potassium uptake protein TrkH [Limnobacter thiooxidans]|uniref:Trk system potassium uptake protein n=1 Tax=Limnobacter thiooxidans TaxID=131080 RepID=A0AA86IX38_9BURK|nr:potassium transporter TrkG [Limnobacter sp.]MCZ8016324.1 TrkH family potassium uptake protein [Limnobacter sp.]RZS39815.1 trk system potassium uptake protein TrkH [Limnobacter thiooxidans]BET24559.1 potassium transporter TrkG [Limnobacter thiooxidans]